MSLNYIFPTFKNVILYKTEFTLENVDNIFTLSMENH